MKLRTNNQEFRVVQSGGDFLHLKDPASFPAGPAVFELTIDGEVTLHPMQVKAVKDSIKVYSEARKSEPSAQMVAEP